MHFLLFTKVRIPCQKDPDTDFVPAMVPILDGNSGICTQGTISDI